MTELDELLSSAPKTTWRPPKMGRREVIYGPPASGKTTLALAIRKAIGGEIHWFDFDETLPHLWPEIEAAGIDPFVSPIPTPKDIDEFLVAYNKVGKGTVVVDTYTGAERLMAKAVNSKFKIESYDMLDFGKGHGAIYAQHNAFFDLMDAKARMGVNTILICHSVIIEIKEQTGVTYHRIQPQIATAKDGKPSPVDNMFNRMDGVRLVSVDVTTTKEQKKIAQSDGTRTVYSGFHPSRLTKGRPAMADYEVKAQFDADFWKAVFK